MKYPSAGRMDSNRIPLIYLLFDTHSELVIVYISLFICRRQMSQPSCVQSLRRSLLRFITMTG